MHCWSRMDKKATHIWNRLISVWISRNKELCDPVNCIYLLNISKSLIIRTVIPLSDNSYCFTKEIHFS